ncbi:Hypothetical protein A7982_08701 [Minicystis rosea]|nr:Hypothetical protein A7982_08701 [Minicystis rosea]
MRAQSSFDYAIVRVVPHVEREEFINVGVIVHCRDHEFLAARIAFDEARLRALAPDADVETIRRHLDVIPLLCEGGPRSGPIGQLPLPERWSWLVATRSTIIQTSPPHTGLCERPEGAMDKLIDEVVKVRRRA